MNISTEKKIMDLGNRLAAVNTVQKTLVEDKAKYQTYNL